MNHHHERKRRQRYATAVLVSFFLLFFILLFWNSRDGIHTPAFVGNAIVSKAQTRVSVEALKQNLTCNLSLVAGWNLVTLTCRNATNSSIENRLASIQDRYISIHTYDATNASDPWKASARGLPSYVLIDLTSHDNTKGYWILMNRSGNLTTSGFREIPTFIQFQQGFVLFGFPSNESKNISDPLSGMDGKYNLVESYNVTSGAWQVYRVNGTSNLSEFSPARGYWINGSTSGYVTVT